MLVVRGPQLDALEEDLERRYLQTLRDELRVAWPDRCEHLGDAELDASLRAGMRRAAHHGIEGSSHVLRFLNVWLVLGPGFDEDPRFPEARAILAAPGVAASVRVNQLCAWTSGHLAAAGGDHEARDV